MRILLVIVVILCNSIISIGQDPIFTDVPIIRALGDKHVGSKVLADVESRMPPNHGYSDRSLMTWVHETTHGLNSNLRNSRYPSNINALYVLNGRCVIIQEPKCQMASVAALVPGSLRGPSFNLYLISAARSWNDKPTYILDEWVAYTNGSLLGEEINEDGWHYELLQAINFSVYSLALANIITTYDQSYDHTQLRSFILWNTNRCLEIHKRLKDKGINSGYLLTIDKYVESLEKAEDAESLREFAKSYLGIDSFYSAYGLHQD